MRQCTPISNTSLLYSCAEIWTEIVYNVYQFRHFKWGGGGVGFKVIEFISAAALKRKKELYNNSQKENAIVCVHNISFPVVFVRMASRPFHDLDGGWQSVTRRKR